MTMKSKARRKSNAGRKTEFGGKPLNFFPGEKLRGAMIEIEERRQNMKLPFAFTFSYLLREGAWILIEHLDSLMREAHRGNLHAKKRVVSYGQKTKKK